jgi:repressor LexA
MLDNSLGKKIKSIRIKHKLSQERFGIRIGVTGKTISAYETGKAKPSLKVLDKISKIYKVSIIQESEENNVSELLTEIKLKIKKLEEQILSL